MLTLVKMIVQCLYLIDCFTILFNCKVNNKNYEDKTGKYIIIISNVIVMCAAGNSLLYQNELCCSLCLNVG